ncbi:hypothetical protein EON65_16310 [archaeon]|nr:MAG: hypothetical protein EON65_16310 [archaeon]
MASFFCKMTGQHRFILIFLMLLIMIHLTSSFRLVFKLRRHPFGSKFSLSSTASSLAQLNKPQSSSSIQQFRSPQFVFVGGKGGVGKTTSSSAIALSFSDSGYKTLIVSTDPAHSLGDALDVDLRSGNIVPIYPEQNLWALEIDINRSLGEFKDIVGELNSDSLARALGVPKDILDSFGLDDLTSVFSNPPPGIDEIVALMEIFAYADQSKNKFGVKFDRIVIDTAPTGHTLRLLQLPTFLSTLTAKLIKFRSKVYGAIESFQSLFGGSSSSGSKDALRLLDKLEVLQEGISKMKSTLKAKDQTQFVIVTIPTKLAVLESERLLTSLSKENIHVSTVICNQVLSQTADEKYLEMRMHGQQQSLNALRSFLTNRVQQSKHLTPIELTEVPYVDTEVIGVHGLRFFYNMAHPYAVNKTTDPQRSRRLTIFGGKGGVGKTTSAASWATLLSDAGFKTLIVSSDPAHSLGDALQVSLSGTPQLLDRSIAGGQLWGMEIDPSTALAEFKDVLTAFSAKQASRDGLGSMLPDIKGELSSLLYDVNDPPPGTDEIVAMAKVICFLDNGFRKADGSIIKFDRIVLDTAPTGHTLRMLELPEVLQQLLLRFRNIRDKASSLSSLFSTEGNIASPTEDRLLAFQQRMARLEALLRNSEETEFLVVTIPTDLAVAETKRLVSSLDKSNVLIRRVTVNQMIATTDKMGGPDKVKAYIDKVRLGQDACIRELENMTSASSERPSLVQVPYFDMEVRTVYGLRVVSNALFPSDISKQ